MPTSISVGSVSVEVVPSARTFASKLRAELTPIAQSLGRDLGNQIGRQVTQEIAKAIPAGIRAGSAGVGAQGGAAGRDYGGKFARDFRAAVEAAFHDLPKPSITLRSNVDRELGDIRAKLYALAHNQIGVDLSAEEALLKLRELRDQLERLRTMHPSPRVTVDAAAAEAHLAAIEAELDRINGKDARAKVDADDGGSIGRITGGLSAMASGLLLLLTLAPAVGAALTAAFFGVAAALVAATAGIGALGLGLLGPLTALRDVHAANQAKISSGGGGGRSNNADQIAAANDALTNAKANAADSSVRSEEEVANAQRKLVQAQRQAARDLASADRGVKDAEQSLSAAQRAALAAQEQLTTARQHAKQAMEDLNNSVIDGALAEREAIQQLDDAQAALNNTSADPFADKKQRDVAQLGFDEATQRLAEIRLQNQRLADEKKDSDKAGVEGAAEVVTAQQGIVDANNSVLASQQRLVDAQDKSAQAQIDAADQIAEAQRGVTDALRNQATQQRQSAYSIAQAQRQVAEAHKAAAAGAGASASAGRKAADALAKLTPEGREFVKFLQSLAPMLRELQNVAQKNLLPGLQAGITALLPLFPGFLSLVGELSKTLGGLFSEAGNSLAKDPAWLRFFKYLGETAGPYLAIFAKILGNLAKGFANLLVDFKPVSDQLGAGLLRLTQRFADWAEHASDSPKFRHFIEYIQTEGPHLMDVLGKVLGAFVHIGEALAPIGKYVLDAFGIMADLIKKVPTKDLTLILGVLLGLLAVFQAIVVASALFAAGLVGAVVGAVVAFEVALVLAYRHCETFRKTVNAAFFALAKDALYLFREVLLPAIDALVAAWEFASHAIETGASVAVGAWRFMQQAAGTMVSLLIRGFKYILDTWLGVVGGILHGAQEAFGWIPEIKDMINPAVEAFDQFRNSVDGTLSQMASDAEKWGKDLGDNFAEGLRSADPAQIRIFIEKKASLDAQQYAYSPHADGGLVQGPGTGTSDSIRALLSNGEYVLRAASVARIGVATLDRMNRYATGGPVGSVPAGHGGGPLVGTLNVQGAGDPSAVADKLLTKLAWLTP